MCLAFCLPEQFAKRRRICKKCNVIRTTVGREAYKKAYRAKNSERRRAYDIEWRSKRPNFWSEYRALRKANGKTWGMDKEWFTAWRKANPEKIRGYNAIHAKRIRQATPLWADKKAIMSIYANRPEGYHVDHIIPLVGVTTEGWKVSGLHIPINLQYLSASENRRKKNNYSNRHSATVRRV